VYGVLLESVSANADTFARHLRLRRRLLGVDQLRPWDWFVPAAKADVRMPYAAAREAVLDSLEPLGEGYRARAEELFEERRIDVYDGPGTLSMEYTSPAYGAPGYVNLSYGDDVGSALGLAHELGHAVHATLSAESQPPAYGGFDGFLAEVPSNVTEALLAEHLLETGDRGTRRAVLGHYLSRFRTMLVDMSVAAGFERRAHDHVEDGGSPSADWLDGAYADLLAEYYGSARLDDRIAARWMRLPLLFREEDWPFYAYQYVVGMAVGLAVAADLLAGDVAMRERYLDLLTAGSRRRPVELIESVGVDPTSSEPVDRAFETYERYLDELAG
jgi:oligoendopeptidase F